MCLFIILCTFFNVGNKLSLVAAVPWCWLKSVLAPYTCIVLSELGVRKCFVYLDGHTQLRQTELPRLQTPQHLQQNLRWNPEALLLCKAPQLLQHPAPRSLPAHLLWQAAQQRGQPARKWNNLRSITATVLQHIRIWWFYALLCTFLTHMQTTCACRSTNGISPQPQ